MDALNQYFFAIHKFGFWAEPSATIEKVFIASEIGNGENGLRMKSWISEPDLKVVLPVSTGIWQFANIFPIEQIQFK